MENYIYYKETFNLEPSVLLHANGDIFSEYLEGLPVNIYQY